MPKVYKKIDRINGIKYWATWYTFRTPRYELFVPVAHETDIDAFYFEALKDRRTVLKKYANELYVDTFKPFCIETKYVKYNWLDMNK